MFLMERHFIIIYVCVICKEKRVNIKYLYQLR